MPFVSLRDQQERVNSLTPYVTPPTFGDVFDASLGQVFDEGLSISAFLNTEGVADRRKRIDDLIQSGAEDGEAFIKPGGLFDYVRFAEEKKIPGIKTNLELQNERKSILAKRRAYAQDVIERGSGMAQFLGAANGYILDPFNISTMGYSTVVVGAKALTISGRALLSARNTAIVVGATELAIQPLVYTHKQSIDSPYSAGDAITAIAFAAVGGGALGGVIGGISGYLSKVRALGKDAQPTADLAVGFENLERLENMVANGRAARDTFDTTMIDYEKMLQGDYDSFAAAAKNSVKVLEGEIKAIRSGEVTLKKFIQDAGGVDRAAAAAEGIDPAAFKLGGAKPLFPKAGGKSLDGVTELLNEIGFRGGRNTIDDVTAMLEDINRGVEDFVSPETRGQIEFRQNQVDALSRSTDGDFLRETFESFRQKDIEADAKYLTEVEEARVVGNRPSKTVEQFTDPEQPKAASAKTTPREREILQNNELTDDFNREMAAFDELETPLIREGEQLIDAKAVMKELDDELAGLESVLMCARG